MQRFSLGLLLVCSLGTMVFATGCGARRVTDFTLISTKNTLLVANAEKRDRRVKGEDCTMTLVGVPNMKTAIDDALDKAGPEYDALVDGVVWMDDKILFQCYRVEGTPLRSKPAADEYEDEEPDRGTTGAVRTERGNKFVKRPEPAPPAPAPAAATPAPKTPQPVEAAPSAEIPAPVRAAESSAPADEDLSAPMASAPDDEPESEPNELFAEEEPATTALEEPLTSEGPQVR